MSLGDSVVCVLTHFPADGRLVFQFGASMKETVIDSFIYVCVYLVGHILLHLCV